MRIFADAHALIWAHVGDSRLSPFASATLTNGINSIFVSAATLWEIAVKMSIGKLKFNVDFATFVQRAVLDQGFTIFGIEPAHLVAVAALPFPTKHRDPFDRMLVAQAKTEGMSILSVDAHLDVYGITRIW